MEIVESRYGGPAKEIVQNLFQLGHTKVSELVAAYEALDKRPNGNSNGHTGANGVNGVRDRDKQVRSAGHLHTILTQLLQAGLIESVNEHMFRSPTDTYNMIERDVLQADYQGSTKGNKQKDELKSKIRDRLRQLRDERGDWKPKAGKKRALTGDLTNGVNGSGKRRRLSNGTVNGDSNYEDEGARLDVGFPSSLEQELIAC
jgi:DNA-directed RNA polymerase III subunit RPC3